MTAVIILKVLSVLPLRPLNDCRHYFEGSVSASSGSIE